MSKQFLFVACIFFAVSTLLSLLSGWLQLMNRFPDRPESPIAEFNRLSGSMGLGVSMRSILRIHPCPSGLRLGMNRLFGPFCREIFVPWNDLIVERKDGILGRIAVLRFRGAPLGRLELAAHIADKIWRAAPGHWPEPGPVPGNESKLAIFNDLAKQWAVNAVILVMFFTIVPRMMASRGWPSPPWHSDVIVVLFLPIMLTIVFAYEYWRRIRD